MGKATIVQNLGGGRYKIRKDAGQSRANAEISALQSKLLEIEQQIVAILNQQAQLDSQLIQAKSSYDQATNEYVVALQGDQNASTQAWEEASENLTTIQLLLAENNRKLQLAQADKASTARRINYLQSLDLVKDIDTWSFDYNENATGEVATIEIPGEPKYTLIAPGARAPTEADGQVLAREVMTGPQAYFNAAILPGWQKFKPTYRRGIITSIDNANNLANVNLINDLSSAQSLNINQQSTLENVPIVYICESSTFVVGDECLIEFLNQNWNTPRIIACGPSSLDQAEFLFGYYTEGRIVFDADAKKIVVVYISRVPYEIRAFAVVGTLNEASIDFGTPVKFGESQSEEFFYTTHILSVSYDPDAKKILIIYENTDIIPVLSPTVPRPIYKFYASAIVGAVNGNSISFGSPVTFYDTGFGDEYFYRFPRVQEVSVVYDHNAQKNVIFYKVQGGEDSSASVTIDTTAYIYSMVGTVTGTSISLTSPVVVASFDVVINVVINWLDSVYDPISKKILFNYAIYQFPEVKSIVFSRVATVNGNSISFGPTVNLITTKYNKLVSIYEPNIQKIIVIYHDAENNYYITFAFAEINGNSINFETISVPDWGKSELTVIQSVAYNPNTQKINILYSDGLNNYFPTVIRAIAENTLINFEAPIVLKNELDNVYPPLTATIPSYSTTLNFSGLIYESNSKKIVGIHSYYEDSGYNTVIASCNYFIMTGASPSTHVFFE